MSSSGIDRLVTQRQARFVDGPIKGDHDRGR